MADRRPFWKWHRWKSIGFCLWPPSTCMWNVKLKFQSKLDLCSGNHAVYRQTDGRTDGRTDKVNPVYPPSNFVGRGYKKLFSSNWWLKLTLISVGPAALSSTTVIRLWCLLIMSRGLCLFKYSSSNKPKLKGSPQAWTHLIQTGYWYYHGLIIPQHSLMWLTQSTAILPVGLVKINHSYFKFCKSTF